MDNTRLPICSFLILLFLLSISGELSPAASRFSSLLPRSQTATPSATPDLFLIGGQHVLPPSPRILSATSTNVPEQRRKLQFSQGATPSATLSPSFSSSQTSSETPTRSPGWSPSATTPFVPFTLPVSNPCSSSACPNAVIASFTGNYLFFTVPLGVYILWVELWGGSSGIDTAGNGQGAGAYVSGFLPVTSGESLRILVAGGGATNGVNPAPGGFGGGGTGLAPDGWSSPGGGGRSAIQRANGTDYFDIVSVGGGAYGWVGGLSCYDMSSQMPINTYPCGKACADSQSSHEGQACQNGGGGGGFCGGGCNGGGSSDIRDLITPFGYNGAFANYGWPKMSMTYIWSPFYQDGIGMNGGNGLVVLVERPSYSFSSTPTPTSSLSVTRSLSVSSSFSPTSSTTPSMLPLAQPPPPTSTSDTGVIASSISAFFRNPATGLALIVSSVIVLVINTIVTALMIYCCPSRCRRSAPLSGAPSLNAKNVENGGSVGSPLYLSARSSPSAISTRTNFSMKPVGVGILRPLALEAPSASSSLRQLSSSSLLQPYRRTPSKRSALETTIGKHSSRRLLDETGGFAAVDNPMKIARI